MGAALWASPFAEEAKGNVRATMADMEMLME